MLTVNVITNGVSDTKRINGSLCGEKFNVPYSEELLLDLKDAQAEYETFTEGDQVPAWIESVKALLEESDVASDVVETACPDLKKDNVTGNYYVVVDGEVSKTPVPDGLVEVILESADKNIDPTPVVKAWIRFLRNPNFTPAKAEKFADYITATIIDFEEAGRLIEEEGFTTESAYDRATYNDVAITQEGLIKTLKYAELITEGWEIDKETNEPVRVSLFPKTPKTVDKITGVVSGDEPVMPDYAEELYFRPPVMKERGDEFFCGETKGHIILVGKKHTLEKWDQVNTNDSVSCVEG